MNNKRIIFIVISALVLLGMIAFWPGVPEPARAEDRSDDLAEQVQKLTKRVTTLEEAVLRDPYNPRETVLARLDAIEKRLTTLERSKSADNLSREINDLKKEMDQQQRAINDLKSRISKLENKR